MTEPSPLKMREGRLKQAVNEDVDVEKPANRVEKANPVNPNVENLANPANPANPLTDYHRRRWRPFIDVLRELSTALDKMSTKLQEHAGRMREQRAQTEPSRDPTNPDDTNVTTIKRHVGSCHQHCQLFPADRALGTNLRHVCAFPCACVGGLNNPRFEALGEALRAVEMYVPVVVTDKMMGIKRNKSSIIARREMRRTYFEQLRFTDMAIKLHTYKRGGPYPF